MKHIAVLGAGAMGTLLGALLSKAGLETVLIDSYAEHVAALNERGARITGVMEETIPVTAIAPDQMRGPYDLVFLLTKTTRNGEALPALLPHLHDGSVVCTMQNGFPEYDVGEIVGLGRTVGCTLRWGATFVRPGVTRLTNAIPEQGAFDLGELGGERTERIRAVAAILGKVGGTTVSDDHVGSRWIKLMHNCAMSGMSAALGSVFKKVVDDDKALTCCVHIAQEVVRVAALKGCAKLIGYGIDPEAMRTFADAAGLERAKRIFHDHYQSFVASKASMLQDLERGIACEIHGINGFVCRAGAEVGYPTPFNDTVVRVVEDIERGALPLDFSNIGQFSV